MQKERKLALFSRFSDRLIIISTVLLAVYGSFMIVSAEMGESTADLGVIFSGAKKQFIYLFLAIVLMIFTMKWLAPFMNKFNNMTVWVCYIAMLILLIIPRGFAPAGGAYAWIRLGKFSIQPSEFAKVFVMFFATKMFDHNNPKENAKNFLRYVIGVLVYVFIVVFIEKDLGSAVVIFIIGYVCALIPPFQSIKKYQNIMMILIVAGLLFALFFLSSAGTKLLENFGDSYQIKRFLSSANPFNYQYDSGYHLIMSLVSIATGGLFGLGYSQSIHKFMNFPNPSTDFILPVIIEEMGIIGGFVPILVLFGFIVIPLAIHAKRCPHGKGKIFMIGTFMYFLAHFIFNVGGVSGLIPLTGVPLLLVSSGGSSLWACMMAIGYCEYEINFYRTRAMEAKCE